MRQEMINEMRKFPNDIAINKPVPGKGGFKNRILFKQPDAKSHHRNGDKSRYKPVGYKNEKGNTIIINLELLVSSGSYDFYD